MAALLVLLVMTPLAAMNTSERERAIVDPPTGLHAIGLFSVAALPYDAPPPLS